LYGTATFLMNGY